VSQPTAAGDTNLLWNLPHELHNAVQVAAPQQDAATDHTVATLGSASSGRDKSAPMLAAPCQTLGTLLQHYLQSWAVM